MNLPDSSLGADKRAAILENALEVFLAYGFARTKMDDIARAANMSRPALYVHFRNKTAIYRALAETMLDAARDKAAAALAADAPLEERLQRAIEVSLLDLVALNSRGPHGAELIDMKNSLAADLIAAWRDAMAEMVSAAIDREARRTGVDLAASGLSADGLADILLDGMEGMKMRISDAEEQAAATARIVRLVALTLHAPTA